MEKIKFRFIVILLLGQLIACNTNPFNSEKIVVSLGSGVVGVRDGKIVKLYEGNSNGRWEYQQGMDFNILTSADEYASIQETDISKNTTQSQIENKPNLKPKNSVNEQLRIDGDFYPGTF